MGRCRYCGEYAGFLSKYHKECHQVKSDAWDNLLDEIETTIVDGSDLGVLKNKIVSICKSSFIDTNEIKELLVVGFSNAVTKFLEDGILSREEEEFAKLFKLHFNLSSQDLNCNNAYNTMAKASVLRDVLNGSFTDGMEQFKWTSPFNFQDEEKLIWLFKDVEYYKNYIWAQHRGGFSGLYIKLDNGVYFRKSSFSGCNLQTNKMIFIDTGSVGITSEHIYFIGETYFSMEYNEITASYGYEDGICIKQVGIDSNLHVFKNIDGWFSYNILANHIQEKQFI